MAMGSFKELSVGAASPNQIGQVADIGDLGELFVGKGLVDPFLEEPNHLHGCDGIEPEALDRGARGNIGEVCAAVRRHIGEGFLDEADDLLNDTLIDFVTQILQHIPEEAQLILSSATVDKEDLEKLRNLKLGKVEVASKKLVEVSLNNAVETARSITLRYCLQPAMLKDAYLLYLLEKYEGNDILVFFNKCE